MESKEKISLLVKRSAEKQLDANLNNVGGLIFINYAGLSAPELSILRGRLNANKARLFVVKNSLSKRVFKNKNLDGLSTFIDGPTGIIFVQNEPVAASKVLVDFAKEHTALTLKAGFVKDRILTKAELEVLSKLPSKEILRAKTVYAIKAPLNNLAGILSQILRKTVLVLKAIGDKKQSQNQ